MPVNQNDILRITAEMNIGGGDVQNVYHFWSTNIPIIGDAQALADASFIMDDLYTLINLSVTVNQAYDQVRVQNVTQDTLLGAAPFPLLAAGGGSGDRLPDQAAALITLPTSKPKVRGGVYLGVLNETAGGSGSKLAASALTAVTNFAAQLLIEQVFGANSYRYVVYNTLLKTFVLPTAAIIHETWRTQRRRRKAVGS